LIIKLNGQFYYQGVTVTAKMYAKGTQTRESILLTAARLFDKKGAFGTSIDDIARELGIAKGTLYQYFASKEDLIVKTIIWSEGILLARLAAIGENGPTDVETAMFEIASRPPCSRSQRHHSLTFGNTETLSPCSFRCHPR